MPFDPKKPKKVPRDGPPDHRQVVALDAVDRAFTDLIRVLTSASCGSHEMHPMIYEMQGPINAAKLWILEN